MKNLKKLLAVLVVVVMVVSTMIPAFAQSYTYSTQAQALYDIGLFKGSTTGTFEPNLGAALDRQQGVVMLIRLLGKEPAALALTTSDVNSTLIIFSDADKLASWAKKHIAYSVLYKYVAGLPDGRFAPNNPLTGKEFGTMLLRAAGYTVDAAGYAGACYQLHTLGVLTFSEAAKFNEKELVRDDFVGMSYATLQLQYRTTKVSFIETLIADKVVTEAKATAAGVFNDQLGATARAAVDAYKAGPIGTLTEIAAAEGKKAAADAAVAKVVVEADKTAFQKEIDTRAAAIAAAKTTLMNDVNAAVNAFVAAPITTVAEITAAEALAVTARAKVATVADATVKADLTKKIDDQAAIVASAKANISGAKVAVNTGSLTTAVVTFDKEMDATKLAGNIKIDGVVVANTAASGYYNLAADKKTLTIAYAAPKAQTANVRIQLTNLKDALGVTMAAFDQTFVVKDITDPAVTSVAVINPKTLRVYTTEPLNIITGFYVVTDLINAGVSIEVNGAAGYAKITQDAAKGYFTLEYSSPFATGENQIVISGAKDNAGFKMPNFSGAINVIADTVAPVAASVTYVAQDKVKVTFTEQVASGGAPYGGVPAFTFKEAGGAEVAIPAGNIAYADTTATLTLPIPMTVAAIVSYEVSYVNVQDTIGNTYTTKKIITGQAPDDTEKPTVAKVEVIAGNKVKVTFSEPVNAGLATFDLYNSTGATLIDGAPTAAVPDTTGAVYTVTFAALANVDAGTYQVNVLSVNDLSIRGNASTAGKVSISALDTKKPTITAAVGTTVASGAQKIEVVYSEAMNTSLIGNVSNYYLGKVVGAPSVADVPLDTISGASVTVNSSNKVTITVPNTAAAYLVISAYGVKDASGNVLDAANPGASINNAFAIQGTYNPYQLTGADLVVKAKTATTIEVSISPAKIAAGYSFTLADRNAFQFVAGATYDILLGTLNAVLSADKTKVTLTTAVGLDTDAKYTTTGSTTIAAGTYPVTVWIDGTKGLVRDQNNQNVLVAKAGAQAVGDGISPTQKSVTGEVVADGAAKVLIQFSEGVNYTAAAGFAAAVKVTVDGKVLYANEDYTCAINAGMIEVNIQKIQGVALAAAASKDVTVQVITATSIKDAAGNAVTPGAATTVTGVIY
ncbi:MAG: S-layer homology domain-containing protein [Eubacteriales bacterium]|nr:S-layer homology domain-containing protein [Eubacteriales bacterium]